MKPATFEIKKEESSTTGVTTQKAIDTIREDSSENTISQDTASVNRNFSENANKYQDRDPDAAIRYSDRTFSYDELVAKGKIIGTTIKNSTEVPLKDDGSIDAGKIVEAEILGKLHAVNAKKIDSSNLKTAEKSTVRGHGEVYFGYSIAHLLEDVKGVFEDTF